MKARRQAVILEVIQRAPVRSQEQLRRSMRVSGFDVTQATLSRDIRIGLVKAVPRRVRAPVQRAQWSRRQVAPAQGLGEYLTRVDRVQQLLVLRTRRGSGPLLGVALDRARREIVGTIAGDDTVRDCARCPPRAGVVKRLEGIAAGSHELKQRIVFACSGN
jgi:transcriptional regulator of arginine metabolism